MTWLPEWLIIAGSLAGIIWPIPVIYWRMADWQDRRAYERRRGHVEELERLEAAPDLRSMQ